MDMARIGSRYVYWAWILLVAGLICAVFLYGCKDSGNDSYKSISGIIGPNGGTVEAVDAVSPIFRAKVIIPADALLAEEEITMASSALPRDLEDLYAGVGECISFTPDGTLFDKPVSLYLPYNDADNDGIVDGTAVDESRVRVLNYNELTGMWDELDVRSRDTVENLAVVQTSHFSIYLASVDTMDAEPYDTTTDMDADTSVYESGECFVGNDTGSACQYYYVTITNRDTGLVGVIDRNATYITSGYPIVIGEDGDSGTFDSASVFEKVLDSQDATLWDWECDFVSEHTFLNDYDAYDDTVVPLDSEGSEAIYCRIEAIDASTVRIAWQIDVHEQVLFKTSPKGNGHMLAIRFRAIYR